MDTKCKYPWCGHAVHCKGWCLAHYKQHRRGEKLRPLRVTSEVPMESVAIRLPPPVAHRVREDVEGARSALVIWAKKAEGK